MALHADGGGGGQKPDTSKPFDFEKAIQHLEGGIIERILVREGQKVRFETETDRRSGKLAVGAIEVV